MDIKIPFAGDMFVSNIQEKQSFMDVTGKLKISPLENTISGKYVENAKSGTLFVVTGQVRNEYDHARSFISIKSGLYTKGKVLAATKTGYCGNILSDTDIQTLGFDVISQRLNNRDGDNQSNKKVDPNKSISFMVVFSNLPDNMEMYNVEVAGSSPYKQ